MVQYYKVIDKPWTLIILPWHGAKETLRNTLAMSYVLAASTGFPCNITFGTYSSPDIHSPKLPTLVSILKTLESTQHSPQKIAIPMGLNVCFNELKYYIGSKGHDVRTMTRGNLLGFKSLIYKLITQGDTKNLPPSLHNFNNVKSILFALQDRNIEIITGVGESLKASLELLAHQNSRILELIHWQFSGQDYNGRIQSLFRLGNSLFKKSSQVNVLGLLETHVVAPCDIHGNPLPWTDHSQLTTYKQYGNLSFTPFWDKDGNPKGFISNSGMVIQLNDLLLLRGKPFPLHNTMFPQVIDYIGLNLDQVRARQQDYDTWGPSLRAKLLHPERGAEIFLSHGHREKTKFRPMVFDTRLLLTQEEHRKCRLHLAGRWVDISGYHLFTVDRNKTILYKPFSSNNEQRATVFSQNDCLTTVAWFLNQLTNTNPKLPLDYQQSISPKWVRSTQTFIELTSKIDKSKPATYTNTRYTDQKETMMAEIPMGAFFDSLKRNNEKIRDDRAAAIVEDAEVIYKREVEDIAIQLKKLQREQENMLDLSPTHADSLVLASDFNAKEYVARDLDLAIKIRNLEIKLELAKARYAYLFGKGGL